VRSESNRGLRCSVASKAVETMTATSKRVLIDGPAANKSFIADASYQLKNAATRFGVYQSRSLNKRFKGGFTLKKKLRFLFYPAFPEPCRHLWQHK
jgi:hypothetical protein